MSGRKVTYWRSGKKFVNHLFEPGSLGSSVILDDGTQLWTAERRSRWQVQWSSGGEHRVGAPRRGVYVPVHLRNSVDYSVTAAKSKKMIWTRF